MEGSAARSLFTGAMLRRDIPFLEDYMTRGFNVNQVIPGPEHNTILHYAIELGYTDVFSVIMRGNPDVNKANANGITPIMMHVIKWSNPDVNIFMKLLEKGADVNHRANNGNILLSYVIHKYNNMNDTQRKYIYKKTLELTTTDINVRNTQGITPLIQSIMINNDIVVGDVLAKGADPNLTNLEGFIPFKRTPLAFAIQNKKVKVIKKLLNAGANINIVDEGSKHSLLCEAVISGEPEILSALIEKHPDLDIQNTTEEHETPLISACILNEIDLVEMLVEAGANLNIRNARGKTALDYAYMELNFLIVEYLTEKGAETTLTPAQQAAAIAQAQEADALAAAQEAEALAQQAQQASNIAVEGEVFGPPLATRAKPANAPAKCFDPIQYNHDVNVETADVATFYILKPDGTVASAGCLDEESLQKYKTDNAFRFYRCKEDTPTSSLHITEDSVHPEEYKLFNFAFKMYIKRNEARQLQIGSAYVLKPEEPIGRIASFGVVHVGSAVSANHCGPADGSMIYSVHKIVPSGGKRLVRRRRFKRTQRRKQKKQRKSVRRARR
jgi:ankyrin repeat protein